MKSKKKKKKKKKKLKNNIYNYAYEDLSKNTLALHKIFN